MLAAVLLAAPGNKDVIAFEMLLVDGSQELPSSRSEMCCSSVAVTFKMSSDCDLSKTYRT